MHSPARRRLQDVLTCIRHHVTLDEAGYLLHPNAERHLKSPAEMLRLFRGHEALVERSLEIVERCSFSLDELRYDYPVDPVPEGSCPQAEMERLTWAGAAERYPGGVPEKVEAQIRHEFELIGQLGYAPYFLTVHDIVRFSRAQGILCQGRGSAANSAVCYCLGITAVDPSRADLLFERFVSAERDEPPDIDVDFEHERREEVIQYIYAKYGRERAGLTATVISYRAKSAIREVGKAFGLSEDVTGRLAGSIWGRSSSAVEEERVAEEGLDLGDPRLKMAIALAEELIGFPRHLSQHVGGFVITEGPLSALCPIENAAMEDRTVIEWDKDDIDALGILKIDVLALGMLSCVRKGFDLLRAHYGLDYNLATLPAEDPAVYSMLSRADSVGVFQVESRAQMTMLPRLKPRDFYDLVIEVAIVRPGPIQGDMVHPYLRRRDGLETVDYPSPELRRVLEKTLGVPLFQEQAMQIAIVAAGFTPTESDGLRRAMATFRRSGTIQLYRQKLIDGMIANGYERDFAERCFRQIEGFGEYGFPESHAASFALLVYVSAWLKRHYPEVFACAILNSQPMGFYAPAQLVRDAREHGVTVRPVDVNHSDWDNTLEPIRAREHALRLGFREIKGFREEDAARLVAARGSGNRGGYATPDELWKRAGIPAAALQKLAEADAFGSMGLNRRAALWAVRGLDRDEPLPLFAAARQREAEVILPEAGIGEEVIADYASLRMSLKDHPLRLLRPRLRGTTPHHLLQNHDHGAKVTVAGLSLVRQRPGSAKGVIFITLEDEFSVSNLIVRPPVFETYRRAVMAGRLLIATGRLQKEGPVIHVMTDSLIDATWMLADLGPPPTIRSQVTPRPGSRIVPATRHDDDGHPVSARQLRASFRSRDFH
jgi:error-prone DNA polymerase